MSEAIAAAAVTDKDMNSVKILTDAATAEIKDAVVIGLKKDGRLYFAGAPADPSRVNMLLDLAKHRLLEIVSGAGAGAPLKRHTGAGSRIVVPN